MVREDIFNDIIFCDIGDGTIECFEHFFLEFDRFDSVLDIEISNLIFCEIGFGI